jgi:hypothetical protein
MLKWIVLMLIVMCGTVVLAEEEIDGKPSRPRKETNPEVSHYYNSTRGSLTSVLQDLNSGDISVDRDTARRLSESLNYCLETVKSLESRGIKGSWQPESSKSQEDRPSYANPEYRRRYGKGVDPG